jgi:phosphoglycolate phosphatase
VNLDTLKSKRVFLAYASCFFTFLSHKVFTLLGMPKYENNERMVFFDADGTTIDAFHAIELAFLHHGMDIGDIDRFQKRRKLFKFLGGLREFPSNLRQQFGKQSRKRLLETLTGVYREEANLYPGIAAMLRTLLDAPDIRVGLVTRNVTNEPEETLRCLFLRHDIDIDKFDYFACIPLAENKSMHLKKARQSFAINPARSYACGDEYSDYLAAINAGAHPFVVSYGFESSTRLINKFCIPDELISTSPAELIDRLGNALSLDAQGSAS